MDKRETQRVKIQAFDQRFAADFKRLNLEWLEGYDLFEPADLKHLDHPYENIISKGGKILMAVQGGKAVGTSAVVVKNSHTVELAKFAVSGHAQGRGTGRRLANESIKLAREMGAAQIILVSNSKLSAALHLYESLGFEHAPMPEGIEYDTADVYMTLNLKDRPDPGDLQLPCDPL